MRILPQNAFEPSYFEPFFLPVVIVFALFNTVYLFLGFILIVDGSVTIFPGEAIFAQPTHVFILCFVFLVAHFILYWRGANGRETQYLQRGSIGIDIDGVLNLHRQHFAAVLKTIGGPTIDPDAIDSLRVSRSGALGVTRQHEIDVLNSLEYWLEMPPDPDASHNIGALRDLGLDIHIVSNRPWPALRDLDKLEQHKLRNAWLSATQKIISKRSVVECLWLTFLYISLKTRPCIEVITKDWLRKHGIPFDSLTIEESRGRDGVHHTRSAASRVGVAHKHSLKFFVEDDWEAAHRLAFICDVVFLIKHPYNEAVAVSKDLFGKGVFTENLPGNVIIVDGWPDIYKAIKRLI